MFFTVTWDSALVWISFIMNAFVFPGVSICLCLSFTLCPYNSPAPGERLFVVCLLFTGFYHFLCCSQRPPFWDFLVSCFYLDCYSLSLNHLSIYSRYLIQHDEKTSLGIMTQQPSFWKVSQSLINPRTPFFPYNIAQIFPRLKGLKILLWCPLRSQDGGRWPLGAVLS